MDMSIGYHTTNQDLMKINLNNLFSHDGVNVSNQLDKLSALQHWLKFYDASDNKRNLQLAAKQVENSRM